MAHITGSDFLSTEKFFSGNIELLDADIATHWDSKV
jgi:hypothetical protein